MIRGFDVSHWQTTLPDPVTHGRYYVPIDYEKAVASGIEFGFFKACDGITDTPCYKEAVAHADQHILAMPYTWLKQYLDAKQQADFWYSRLKTRPAIAIDFENYAGDYPTGAKLKAAIVRLTEIGYTGKIGIYSSHDYLMGWAKNELPWLKENTDFLWLSDPDSLPLIPVPFTKYDFWQYTWTAYAPDYGITNGTDELDLDYFNGTRDELLALFGNVPIPPPIGENDMEITPKYVSGSKIRNAAFATALQVGSLAFGSKLAVVSLVGNAGTEQWAEVIWMAKPAYVNVWLGGAQNATLSGTLPPPSGAGASVEMYANGALVHSANVAAGGKVRIDITD